MSTLGTTSAYRGETSRLHSPSFWWDCPFVTAPPRRDDGVYVFDDFNNFHGTVTSNVGTYNGGYKSYEDTGDSIAQVATELGGVANLLTDTSDNDEVWLQSCGGAGVLGKVVTLTGKMFWFEARVKLAQIVTQNFFVGLGEEGLAAADTITDAGALASKDLLGFQVLEDDTDAFDTVFRKAGQTAQVVKDVAQAITASTYYKLGMKYFPPSDSGGERIVYYVNGTPLTDYVTASQIAASTFPSGEELAMLVGIKNSTTTAVSAFIDWWAFAQLAY